MSDSAQDFLEQLKDMPAERQSVTVRTLLTRVAEDPALIMREYVPEEVVAASAIVAAANLAPQTAEWADSTELRQVISAIPNEETLLDAARRALDAAVSYGNSWLLTSWKNDNDRQSAATQLDEIRTALATNQHH